jgi:hypothetical protein
MALRHKARAARYAGVNGLRLVDPNELMAKLRALKPIEPGEILDATRVSAVPIIVVQSEAGKAMKH